MREALGTEINLHFIRNKEGREIDFVICDSGVPLHFIESKWTDPKISKYLATIATRFPSAKATLLVRHLRQREQRDLKSVEPAADWLANLGISK